MARDAIFRSRPIEGRFRKPWCQRAGDATRNREADPHRCLSAVELAASQSMRSVLQLRKKLLLFKPINLLRDIWKREMRLDELHFLF